MNSSSRLNSAYDPEDFRAAGHRLVDFLADRLQDSFEAKNDKTIEYCLPEEAYLEFSKLGNQQHADPQKLFEAVYNKCIRLHDPRFMGHQIMPPVPIAALAGFFSDFVNNGMGVYEMGIAGCAIERWVVEQVAQKIGFESEADGVMTCGGSLANLTAMLAARANVARGEVWNSGVTEKLAVMVSDQSHYCVDRAARIMGWGEAGIIKIATDERYKMRTDCLQQELEAAKSRGIHPIAVIGSACSTSTGSFDDLRAIGEFCQSNELWFHVDGAHGAANALSEKHKHLVDGIELADSVTLDFHKMLMTPAVCSALIFRDGNKSYRSFLQQADYLWAESESPEWFNLARRTFECTKTMLGLKVFSIIAVHGWQLFDVNVTRLNAMALQFSEMLTSAEDFELAVVPETNIVCFRFLGDGRSDDLNELNRSIRKQLLENGEFYVVQTTLDDIAYLRTTISNPFSSVQDFDELMKKIRSCE